MGPSSQSRLSQRIPSRIASVISSRERSTSVSSMRRMKVPPSFRAKSQLKRAVRAPPTWRYPVGDGAKRTRIIPVILACPLESEDLAKRGPEEFARFHQHRPLPPGLQIEASGRLHVLLEIGEQPRRKIAVRHRDIQLVVELERSVVEVRRSEHAPHTVDDEGLRVHHGRLVLVDLDAQFHQLVVVLP